MITERKRGLDVYMIEPTNAVVTQIAESHWNRVSLQVENAGPATHGGFDTTNSATDPRNCVTEEWDGATVESQQSTSWWLNLARKLPGQKHSSCASTVSNTNKVQGRGRRRGLSDQICTLLDLVINLLLYTPGLGGKCMILALDSLRMKAKTSAERHA